MSPPNLVDVGFEGQLNDKIVAQGNIVRDLKAKKAEKAEIEEAVKILLSLKVITDIFCFTFLKVTFFVYNTKAMECLFVYTSVCGSAFWASGHQNFWTVAI